MTLETTKFLFIRDLSRLRTEIESYKDESNIWITAHNIANSGGNLCLHLVGNLNAFIGVGLAHSGYKRERDLEFSLKNVPREELISKINETINMIDFAFENLDLNKIDEDFPIQIWEKPESIAHTLLLLATHLSYHLGQVNYHRRLLDLP